ncbi:MAG: DUF3857 domain-containing protein [Chitinophagaceae bacterium]
MRNYLAALLAVMCCTLQLAAQDAEEPEFKGTAVPEKWQQESAVILAQKLDYAYLRRAMGNNMTIREYVRKRIKLQDKNALEKFSEFYYVTYGKKTEVVFTIIKAGGKVVNVDMASAIEVDKDVDKVFRPIYLSGKSSYYKIAIPDLEIGDIIDYHFASDEDLSLAKGSGEFTPYIFALSEDYPVIYQKYQFELDKGMQIKFRSFNGAPKIQEGDEGYEKAADKRSLVTYAIVDRNRGKTSEERWSYTFRNSPTVKLKIAYNSGGLSNTLFGKKGEATSVGVTMEQLKVMYGSVRYYSSPVVEAVYKDIYDYLKNNDKDELSPDLLVREIYYAFRKVFLEGYYRGDIKGQGQGAYSKVRSKIDARSKKSSEKDDQITVNKILWAAVLNRVCTKLKLDVEILIVMPRYLGTWDEMLFEEELDIAMRMRGNKYYTLFPFDNFDVFAHPSVVYNDANAFAIPIGRDGTGYYKADIPASTCVENSSRQESVITIPETMDLLKIERTSSYSGLEKNDVIELAHYDRAYLNKDFARYIVNPKKVSETGTNYVDPDKDERKKTQLEYLRKSVEREDVEVASYDKFQLVSDGRFDETPMLTYKEVFSIKKLLNKAGRNYLLDIGKLIGAQVKLEEKELTKRENDIWIAYARTISNSFTINLPAGYIVEGLQDLNMNIDNASGSFISTAKQQGNQLLVTTTKVYKKNFDKKERWPDYVAFLEAAYKFTQVKVVLKKQG